MGIRVSCCLSAYIDKLCFYLPKLTGMHVTFGSFPVETCEMCVAVYLPNLICVSDHYTFYFWSKQRGLVACFKLCCASTVSDFVDFYYRIGFQLVSIFSALGRFLW